MNLLMYRCTLLQSEQIVTDFKKNPFCVQPIVLPVIDNADMSYSNSCHVSLNILDGLHYNCISVVFGLRQYAHIFAFHRQLQWFSTRVQVLKNFIYSSLFCSTRLQLIALDPCFPTLRRLRITQPESKLPRTTYYFNNYILSVVLKTVQK